MKNRKFKKGFTLVELIVVIAIVAILAAVSVLSYLGFVRQANESADIQLVKQLNTALQGDEVLNGPRSTMHEMLGAMEDNGFVVENLTKTKSGYDIVWDQTNNRFALLDGEKLVYGEESFNSTKIYNTWKFADTLSEAENNKYSVYLTDEFAKNNVTTPLLTISAGLDVGNYLNLSNIVYENTGNGQDVLIRTMGGTLSVQGQNDTVSHFGFATTVNCKDVKVGTYNENGKVGRLIYSDNNGKIYFDSTAVTYCYMNISSDSNANLSSNIKNTNAKIYTNVNSGGTAEVFENRTVTITNGIVSVSDCTNHGSDYDIVQLGKVTYVLCKCCGGYSKYSVDSDHHLVTENGEGISEDNSFGVDNSELGLDIVEEPKPVVSCEYYDGQSWIDLYFTSLEEAFAASKASEDADEGYFELHLLCDLEVNTIFALKEVGDTYVSEIYLDNHTLSGNLFLNGTTLYLYDGTVTANIYLNDPTKVTTTQNCALELGCDEDYDEGDTHPVTATGQITLNGAESSLTINKGSSATNIVKNNGQVIDYNND